MQTIKKDDLVMKVNIVNKANKNTYFYFKKEGYIEVRLSVHHTETYIIKHLQKNFNKFYKKLQKVTITKKVDPSIYMYLGKPLKIVIDPPALEIKIEDNTIILPEIHADQLIIFERQTIQSVLRSFKEKYINNPYVDIKNIKMKTRYTTSRFGSCNARKGNINISTYLMHYDIKYIEYVFLHEIAHLNHQNHGPKFYQLLDILCPNHKELKKELREQFR